METTCDKHAGIIESEIWRNNTGTGRTTMDIENRSGICVWSNKTIRRNKQTLQLSDIRRKFERILQIQKMILRFI